ncbi:hypothetical protein OEA41_007698 [Lepraria neglecta]|uniref:PEBP-like protein n=1 Tax=Lepraria neglecta TaxID=209136 RepID=A0AAD9ZE14_9LECA|nr:hypothetical protein OEA41_007698 [Lepraria neglecta]
MHVQALLLAATALVSQVYCQTLPGTQPSTNGNLPVAYGTTKVTPGIMLDIALTKMFPTISYTPTSTNQTYVVLLVDLSINAATINQSALVPDMQLPLAPGVNANRTTRLHYWQPGLTFTSNSTVVNTTTPIAFYNPPGPPAGDIAHTYTFYLFEQEATFMPPADNSILSQGMVNMGMNRMSFNVKNFVEGDGRWPIGCGELYHGAGYHGQCHGYQR